MKKSFLIFSGILFFGSLVLPVEFVQAATLGATPLTAPINNLGLVGYWPLDSVSGTTVTDNSGTGNTGETVNGPVLIRGKVGQALAFSYNQAVNIANAASLSPTASITLSAWVNPTSSGGYQTIIGKGYDSTYEIDTGGGTNSVRFVLMNSAPSAFVNFTVSNILPLNQWTLVTATYDGSVARLYANGVLVGSQSVVDTIRVTAYMVTLAAGDNHLDGSLDDARIYNRALSASEVTAQYRVGVSTHAASPTHLITNGLVGYWTFDGANTNWISSTVSDVSGSGNDGTLVSMSTTTSPVMGRIGQALSFNGTNQYATSAGFSFTNSNFTFSFWVNPTTIAGSPVVLYKGNYQVSGYYDQINSDGSINFRTNQSAASQLSSTAAGVIVSGKWTHVVYVRNGASVLIYANGVDKTSTNQSHIDPAGTTSLFQLGAYDTGSPNYFSGAVDDFRAYSRALSASEIQTLYNTGAPDKAAVIGRVSANVLSGGGLVGYWPFDGNALNWATGKATDMSSGGDNLSFVNMATSTSPVAGKIGQALSFNGTNQYLSYAPYIGALNFGTGNFSVSFWMNPLSPWGTVATVGLIGQKLNDTTNGWQIYQDSAHTGKLDMRLALNNNFFTTTSISTGVWSFITFVRSGGTTYWYINGVQDSTGSNSSALSDTTSAFDIGFAPSWTAYYTGSLDDVRIYNRAISAQEVKTLYNLSR